jgi:hypothetical protein
MQVVPIPRHILALNEPPVPTTSSPDAPADQTWVDTFRHNRRSLSWLMTCVKKCLARRARSTSIAVLFI